MKTKTKLRAGLITETTIPACDGGSKDSAYRR